MTTLIGLTTLGGTVQFEADGREVETVDVSHWKQGTGGILGKSYTAVAGAVTAPRENPMITTESLTTAAGAEYTLTVTNKNALASDFLFTTIQNGTNSAGAPMVRQVQPAIGSYVITVRNVHASAAFNGTLKIGVFTMRA